jgi:hypothetical protein
VFPHVESLAGGRVFRGTGGGVHLSGVDKAEDEAM